MDDLLRLLTLQDFNTRVVLAGTALLGGACGVVGVFATLRGRALVADALAHAALPGVVIAFVIALSAFGASAARSVPVLLLGALVAGVLSVLALTLIRRVSRVREDAAIALTLSVSFGLGVALLTRVQRSGGGEHAGLSGFIFGKAAGMLAQDVMMLGAVAIVVIGSCVALIRPLQALCFDREFAHAVGLRVTALDLLLMALVCVCTVAALPAVGLVLVVALLTIPPSAARFWTDRVGVMLAISGALGAASALLGTSISALVPKLSAGPVITLCAAAMFVVSMLAAPRRGLVVQWIRRERLRGAVAQQNLLRALYEAGESPRAPASSPAPVALAQLMPRRSWSLRTLESLLRRTHRAGLTLQDERGVTLTPEGRRAAAAVVRAHRLWELYLLEQGDIAPDRVDRDADRLEHVLPPDLIAHLDHRLRELGRLPPEADALHPPTSPHAIPVATKAGTHE